MADITETHEHFQPLWDDVFEQTGDIKTVIQKYNELGFHSTCDLPANAYWKELYQNVENCKDAVFDCQNFHDGDQELFYTYF